jgi:hypothetical protein
VAAEGGEGLVRCCRVCSKCGWREFSDPEARCPEHGVGVTEENRPDLDGEAVQHPSFDAQAWARVEAKRASAS